MIKEFYELTPRFDSAKSFYNKAQILTDENGNQILQSYDTMICKIDSNGNFEMLCDVYALSNTTLRHLKEFCKQFFEQYGNYKKCDFVKLIKN